MVKLQFSDENLPLITDIKQNLSQRVGKKQTQVSTVRVLICTLEKG